MGNLTVAESGPVAFTGYRGDRFDPDFVQLNLGAAGAAIEWSADAPSWIEVSPPRGRLDRDANIKVAIRAAANAASLFADRYEGEITFRIEGAGEARRVPVRLQVLDPAPECDALMASRFDPDRPATAAFRVDAAALTNDDLERAIRVCEAAIRSDKSPGARRFYVQKGRAMAAQAVKLAKDRKEAPARQAMDAAVSLWNEGADRGSSAAMNLLGYYWQGRFDEEVGGPVPDAQCAAPTASADRFSFARLEIEKAMSFYGRAATADPPNTSAMVSLGSLYLLAGDLCPPRPDVQNTAEGVRLLKRAIDLRNVRAAAILGVEYYLGRVPNLAKSRDEGLELLAVACREGDAYAKEKVPQLMKNKSDPLPAAKRPSGC